MLSRVVHPAGLRVLSSGRWWDRGYLRMTYVQEGEIYLTIGTSIPVGWVPARYSAEYRSAAGGGVRNLCACADHRGRRQEFRHCVRKSLRNMGGVAPSGFNDVEIETRGNVETR